MTERFTFSLSESTAVALDALAAKTTRPRDWLVTRAAEDFVALSAWQLDKIEAGIAAADSGAFATDDEVA
ncbi:CopG family ribbon-helix-helix protein, partial [Beijerinckia sp. L45]|uniref:CopG family ribbon-helix-helix protein n=1 Tax=Beijerinckia sp. L45 TaxID=1641855 RepID=UPI00131CE3BC